MNKAHENYGKVLDLARKQLARQVDLCMQAGKACNKVLFPFVTRGGKWLWDDKWSNGFFPGQLWLLYAIDKGQFWQDSADKFTRAIEHYKNQGDFQDIGYLFIYSYINGYKATGNPIYKQTALEAADNLFEALTPGGYLKCNWLEEGEWFQGIDEMMNIGLWLWAYNETNENKYKAAVEKCVDKIIDTMVFPDGRTCEYVKLGPNAEVIEIYNKNAAKNDTVWARGHSWAIYGMVQAFLSTNNKYYLEVIDKLTGFYVENAEEDLVPLWDLLIKDKTEIRDASAASIAASAFVQLSNGLEEQHAKQKYLDLGLRLLDTLTSEKYLNYNNDDHEGILLHASTPQKFVWTEGESQVWGDYFLLEAITNVRRV